MSEKTKKGFFSKMGNMFFESDGNENESSDDSLEDLHTHATPYTVEPSATVYTESMQIPTSGDGVFDQKFNDAFQALIAENNIPGIDYFEFKQALSQLSGVAGLNEAASFQTAFITLKVGDPKLSKEILISSIEHYDGILSTEEGEFNSAMQSENEKEVASRRNRASALNDENQDIIAQIQKLNEKIAENQSESIKLNNEAAIAEVNISQTAKNFSKTLSHVRGNLESDKQKINSLIQ
jgi:hypothetical protein